MLVPGWGLALGCPLGPCQPPHGTKAKLTLDSVALSLYITTSLGCFRVTVRNGCPVIELEGRGSLLVAPKTAAKVEILPSL